MSNISVNSDQEAPQETPLGYVEGKGFIKLVIITSLLTIITLGIYRFWRNARIRRYYWSATRLGGDPFEYRGTGLEAFLGFLIVVLILSVYIGIIVSILYLVGVSAFASLQSFQLIAMVSLLPFAYFAQYRLRRYLASRTRWRGIRMGLENGAIGYMGRAMLYLLLTIMTFGILAPYGRFKLEKYVADRFWLGDQKLTQGGSWKSLYRFFWPLPLIGVILALCFAIFFDSVEISDPAAEPSTPFIFGISAVFILFGLAMNLFFIRYIVRSQGYMLDQKALGEHIRFKTHFRSRDVIIKYILGAILATVISSVVIAMIALLFGAIFFILWAIFPDLAMNFVTSFEGDSPSDALAFGVIGGMVLLYLGMFIVMMASSQIFITQPITKYIVSHISVNNPGKLDEIKQRQGDDIVDADGFADALDIGFGF